MIPLFLVMVLFVWVSGGSSPWGGGGGGQLKLTHSYRLLLGGAKMRKDPEGLDRLSFIHIICTD